MLIYFDTCCLNRPLDDKSQLRVALEGEAILGLLSRCESGIDTLASSAALILENDRNPHDQRRQFVSAVLALASQETPVTGEVAQRAKMLEQQGFKAFDALHVACAEAGGVDCPCTCDDRFLGKSRRQSDIKVQVVSPLELAEKVSK